MNHEILEQRKLEVCIKETEDINWLKEVAINLSKQAYFAKETIKTLLQEDMPDIEKYLSMAQEVKE